MSTFLQLKPNISVNLDDTGNVHYTDADLNTSLQNGYNDIVALSQCIIKKVTLNWISDLSYYDFVVDCGVTDYLATVAIFNNINNRWLNDNISLYQFDDLRDNWELWHSVPTHWAFAAFNKTVILPKEEIASGTFDLYYWATAPSISDVSSPLIATDCQKLLEFYCTAEQLEDATELTKAGMFWELYFTLLDQYSDRMKSLAQSDLRIFI